MAGIHTAANPLPKIAIPSTCPQAKTISLGLASPPMEENRARHLAKWGGPFNHEVFETPFGDPALTIKDWGPADPPGGGTWKAYVAKHGLPSAPASV